MHLTGYLSHNQLQDYDSGRSDENSDGKGMNGKVRSQTRSPPTRRTILPYSWKEQIQRDACLPICLFLPLSNSLHFHVVDRSRDDNYTNKQTKSEPPPIMNLA